jgi:hypothetical protein
VLLGSAILLWVSERKNEERIRQMARQKNQPTEADVDTFLNQVADEQQRADAFHLLALMKEITGKPPRMWGPSMVGFGEFHYVYASGHEGDTFLIGFAPRKSALVLYFLPGLEERFAAQLAKLGKVKTGKGCLHIKKLADVDLDVLREMIRANVAQAVQQSALPSEPAPTNKSRKKS